ncbi:MAG: hypothetical protein ABR520_11185 [Mycobacteriales bacterium]|nr:hypothetical protein [Actinomycetota bacterium]
MVDPAEHILVDALGDPEAAPAKKRRKSSISPTSRTLAECRKRGWIAQVVEQHLPFPKPFGTKRDLFGVIDIVAICPGCPSDFSDAPFIGRPSIVAIQATSALTGGNHAARRAKILAEPRAKAWVEAGGRLELWSWSKRGDRGKAKRWTLRVEAFTAESWSGAAAEVSEG